VSSRPSLFSQPSVVGEQIGDIFGLLTDICALVLAILVDVLELLESLDNVDIVTEIDDDVLRASVQTVIEKSKRLKRILAR
jgi:energy-converting hydrogenase Eha subunit H